MEAKSKCSRLDLQGAGPLQSVDARATEIRVQELCESRGGRPGLSVLMSLTVSIYFINFPLGLIKYILFCGRKAILNHA